jgi:hypothetical protein
MLLKRNLRRSGFLSALGMILSIIALLAGTTTALAVKYTINTNNSSISEWSGIAPLLTDPSGDASDARDDIINAWVATGTDNNLYFMIEVATTPALSSCTSSNPHGSAVLIDCDDDGIEREPHDRIINYGCYSDGVTVCAGDRSQCMQYEGAEFGERVNSAGNGYVEWMIFNAELLDQSPYIPGDCWTDVNPDFPYHPGGFRFRVVQVTTGTIYDETILARFDIPTVATFEEMKATNQSHPRNLQLVMFAGGLLALAGLSGLLFFMFRGLRARLAHSLAHTPRNRY